METVEELSIEYFEEDGTQTIKQLDKAVLTKGAWATVMFLHQDLNRTSKEYSEPKVTIKRFRKMNGMYKSQSKFTISSPKQAKQIIDILSQWTEKLGEEE